MNHMRMKNAVLTLTIVLSVLSLVGCGAGLPQPQVGGGSQEVKDIAVEKIIDVEKSLNTQTRDHKVSCAKKLDLSDSDRSVGVTERWCVKVEYKKMGPYDKEWFPDSDISVLRKRLDRREYDSYWGSCGCD